MKKVFFKITGVNLLLCFLSFQIQAQDKSQIRFSVSPILYDNLTLSHEGKKLLNTSKTLNGQGLISYYQPIGSEYGINAGLGLRLTSYNINYDFETPENSVFNNGIATGNLEINHNAYSNALYMVPVSFQKTFKSKSSMRYSLELGATANFVYRKELLENTRVRYQNLEDGSDQLFGMTLDNLPETTKMLSYFIKVGLIKGNKIGDSFHVNLVANYSPKLISSGSYEFFNLGYESSGSIEQNINYIGIEFSYGLSLNNKKHSK